MKKVLILLVGILISLILVDSVFAQLEQGKTELSVGAAYTGVQPVQQEEESHFAVNLSTRIGYFLTKRFEIEPEMIFSAYGHQHAGIILDANLLYNLPWPEGTRVFPFLLAGGGWAHAGHLSNQINSGEVDINYTVLNLGMGTRFFLNNSVAMRLEYRFQRFFAKYDPSLNCHNVLVGLSFAF